MMQVWRTKQRGAVQVAAAAKATHSQNVIDALLTTLLQFTRAADPAQPYAHAIVAFGSSTLAREATVTLFDIAADYADLMRSGWATALDCLLRLHRCRLVEPAVFTDAQVPPPRPPAACIRCGRPVSYLPCALPPSDAVRGFSLNP